ncbi:I78 family peptidase inhibitor [Roseobacteraceae bacterium S113]
MFPIRQQFTAVVSMGLLAGCMPQQGANAPPPMTYDAPLCSAVHYASLKGQPASAAESIPQPKRVIAPGSAVTADHNPSRTNVDLDKGGKITRVWCG